MKNDTNTDLIAFIAILNKSGDNFTITESSNMQGYVIVTLIVCENGIDFCFNADGDALSSI